jgi:hypothetical protein
MDRIERAILLDRLRHNISLEDFKKLNLKGLEPLKQEVEMEIRKETTKDNGKYVDLKNFSK